MSEKKIALLKRKLRNTSVHSELIDIHKELAEHLFDAGQHQDALDHLKEALTYCTKQLQTSQLQRLIGEIYIEMGKAELAEPYFRQYLKNSESDVKEVQKSLLTLGRYLYIRAVELKHIWIEGSRQMLTEAKSHLEEALKLDVKLTADNVKDLPMLCRIYLNLGLVSEELEGAREAAIHLKKARNIADEGGLREEEFRCLTITATLFRRHGGADIAMSLMQGAAFKAAKQAGTETQCQHAMDYAEHLIADNKLEDAGKCLAVALKLKPLPRTIKDTILIKYKEVQRAIKLSQYLTTINEQDKDTKLTVAVKLAKFYCSIESCHTKAIDLLCDKVNAIELTNVNRESVAKLHNVLGYALRLNCQFTDAVTNYEKSTVLMKRSGTLRELALCKLRSNRPYNEVMSVLEEASRIDVDMKGFRSASTLDYMIYTRKSFGMPVDILQDERDNLAYSEDDSSSDSVDSSDEIDSPLLSDIDDTEEVNEKIEISRNNKGETPLHIASAKGHIDTVRKLVFKEKHPINIRDFNGWLPLHEAVNFNRLEVVKLLLDNGAAINDQGADEGTSPLHDACQNGLLDCIQLLLEYGANPCLKTAAGYTPLDLLFKVRNESNCSETEIIKCQAVENKLLEIIRRSIPDYEIRKEYVTSSNRKGKRRSESRKSNNVHDGNFTDACKSVLQVYCHDEPHVNQSSSKRKKLAKSPLKLTNKRKSVSAFVPEEDYDVQFTVPDSYIEFIDTSNSSSNSLSPNPKHNSKSTNVSVSHSASPSSSTLLPQSLAYQVSNSKRLRVIAHIDSSPQSKLLIPFRRFSTVQELKLEIESRICRKLNHIKQWANSDIYDMNDCMLDEVDIIDDLLENESVQEWSVKVRLHN
ncbi:hypothetical protein GJ496_003137 [Pomphorhynchus laevis]|nr:hypothetical protein GJ496_003137 [Pomphorhynchus laevis]